MAQRGGRPKNIDLAENFTKIRGDNKRKPKKKNKHCNIYL